MTTGIFDKILQQGIRNNVIPARTEQARVWYRHATGREVERMGGRINENKIMKDYGSRLTTNIKVGSMYMFYYDPRWKDELPYYDRFPLIFPFRIEKDRIWGINLHYLGLRERAALMDKLYDIANNRRYDETTRLQISYQTLNAASKFRFFKPCVKQYLLSHLKSQFLYVYPAEWDIAMFLSVERFTKATKAQVYADSKRKLGIRS